MENKIPVGLELYSVRKSLSADMEGTLEAVRGFGYTAVEFASRTSVFDAKRIAAAISYSDLTVSSWHCQYDELLCDDEAFKKTVEYMLTFGNRYVIIPGLPADWLASDEAIKSAAEKLNALCEKLKPYGMFTGYHNHTAEFKKLESGRTAWTALREETCPEFVMQLDTGNALSGGADVNGELFAAEGRSQIVHLKPYSLTKGYDTMIAADDDAIDYKSIMNFCRERGGTHTYIIEYESAALHSSDMEGVRWAIFNLKKYYGDLL